MKKKETIRSLWTPTAGMLTGARRVAMLLLTTLLLTMTAQTARADYEYTYNDLREQISSNVVDNKVTLAPGTYTYEEGNGDTFIIENSIEIDGNGAVIDMAGSALRAFVINVAGVTIKNLTIKNANYTNGKGGAIYFNKSGTVENCIFINNKASEEGGAIYFHDGGSVTNCAFVNNSASSGNAISSDKELSSIDNNWWGSNNPESEWQKLIHIANNQVPSSWLLLNATANPDEIPLGGNSAIVFNLKSYDGVVFSDFNGPLNFQLILTQTKGELDKATASLGDEIIYTAREVGHGSVTATVGSVSYTVDIPVTVNYIDAEGNKQTVYAVALTGDENDIGETNKDTWYIAQGSLAYNVLSISGNCHLILADGAALNLSNQISYSSPSSLTIYAQSTGEAMGALTVATTSPYAAVATNGGDLTINGGRISISSTGNDGINTTHYSGDPGTLTINGGNVTCIGGPDNKGINTGGDDGLAHYVHNGGTVDFGSGALTFIFNANGGSGTMSNQKIIVNHTKELHACTFTREDCVFEGWATTADGPVVYTNEQSITPTEAGSVTLYAKWRSVVYLIAFDANGGTGNMSNQKITVGETQNLHACTFTLENCVFDGWATTADGNVAYTNEQSITPTEAGSVTLYAKWSYVAYFIAFDANGGSGTMSNQRINVGETQNLTDCTFTRNGYSFAGWATTADGEVAYNNGAPITASATGFLKLYAKWVLLDWAATHSGDSWNDAYIIYEVSQLEEIATNVNAGTTYKDKYFKLGGNITYDNTLTNNHIAIGTSTNPFMGHFDGQGYTISGIRMNGTGDYGLFGFINDSGAEVKNLTLADAQINVGPGNTGGIVGYKKDGAIVNCRVTSDVIINVSNTYGDTYYGGIIGQNYKGAIEYCVSSASVIDATGNQYVGYGGIAGWGAPRNCLVIDATISSPQGYVGAVAGYGGFGEGNNVYTYGTKVNSATGSGHGHGSGTDEASRNKMGYVVTTLPELIPAATGDLPVKVFDGYGLQYNGTNYITLFPLSEDEGVSYLTTYLKSEPSVPVEFKRTFTSGVASTLCLPFDHTPASTVGTFYDFTSVNGDWTEVTMTEVNTSLTANTPYLFKSAATGEQTFSGTATNGATAGTKTVGDWTFTGTYAENRWDVNTNNTERRIFGFATGQGYEGTAASTAAGVFIRLNSGGIKPFRAYLEYTGSLQARTRGEGGLPETMTVRLVNANGEIQGIGEIRLSTGEVTFDSRAWYDLNGRRLDGKPSEKGIYINGGRKVVIK